MSTTVCIPWRPAPDRIAAHDRIVAFWNHFGYPIIEANSDPRQPFSLSEARNNAVRQAKTATVIVADADTLPDIAAVIAGINATRTGAVVWPYTIFRHIPNKWADKSDLLAAPVDYQYASSVGGIFIAARQTYWNLGGMDEMFGPRWGYDDNAFHAVAETLATVTRTPGVVYSFNHAADRDMTDANPNRARWQLYKFAHQKPAVMKQLIEIR